MTKTASLGRRGALGLGLATGATALAPRRVRAQANEVKIAMLVPLSGPWARQGILEQMGARMAIDDINNAGGIKALGGAKLRLIEYDTGDSAEKAKDAAQRMIAQEPDLVGGFGCWLSTFTLAATEVTERAELPWLTLSYSDLITGRGYKYVFQSSPTADAQAEAEVPMVVDMAQKATGKRPTKVAIIGDNTAASVSFMKPIRDHVLKNLDLTLVADEVYTPPLADATTIVQHARCLQHVFRNIDTDIAADSATEQGQCLATPTAKFCKCAEIPFANRVERDLVQIGKVFLRVRIFEIGGIGRRDFVVMAPLDLRSGRQEMLREQRDSTCRHAITMGAVGRNESIALKRQRQPGLRAS